MYRHSRPFCERDGLQPYGAPLVIQSFLGDIAYVDVKTP